MNTFAKRLLAAAGIAASLSQSASACAVCSGASDAPIAPAINASIFLLLGIIATVGGTFFYFLLYLARHDGLANEDTNLNLPNLSECSGKPA